MAAASPKYKFIATGAEGMVVRPALPNIDPGTGSEVEFPDKVTKIFYTERYLKKAQSNFESLKRLMGGKNASRTSNGYTKKYTLSDINPASGLYNVLISDELSKHGVTKADNNLHLLRMPDLGVDIHKIGDAKHMEELTQLKHLPFNIFLEQFRKVFSQLQNLTANRYLHTDIRTTNVMIKPKSGEISIIDFGWLMPYDDLFTSYFRSFGYYANPPECLLLRIGRISADPSVVVSQLLNEKISASALIFGIAVAWIDEYVRQNTKFGLISDELRYRTELSAALSDNIAYLREKAKPADAATTNFINAVFPTFDAYGLAITLLILLKKVYAIDPMDMPADVDVLSRHLKDRVISKGGEPYSEEEFKRMASALIAVVDLFKREASMKIRERLLPDAVVAALDAILAQFRGAPANTEVLGGVGAPAGGAGAATPARGTGNDLKKGGSRRRHRKLNKTRRRSRKN